MDWLDLLAVQGTLKSLLQHHSSKTSILQSSAFFIVQLSPPYMTTGKTIALTRWTFVGKVMSLLFNLQQIRGSLECFRQRKEIGHQCWTSRTDAQKPEAEALLQPGRELMRKRRPVREGRPGLRLDPKRTLGAGREAPALLRPVTARSSVTPEGQASSQPGSEGSWVNRAVGWSLSIPCPITAQGLT